MYSDKVKYLGIVHADVTDYEKERVDDNGKLNVVSMDT